MGKSVVFVLSSLNDPHFQKRVKEFIGHGYSVFVYGFLREGQGVPVLDYKYTVLGTIRERDYFSRLALYFKSMYKLAKKYRGSVFFFSSLDIALFARLFIRGKYIYEVCDLTEMALNSKLLRNFLLAANKNTIRKSLITILTSQGFASFFNGLDESKYVVIPNRVSPECPKAIPRRPAKDGVLRIGFVGVVRFESVYHFVNACKGVSKTEIHIYGIFSEGDKWGGRIQCLIGDYDNIVYHGRFSNPVDLPSIYSNIDLVLCAYTPSPGVNYAEPNKLYESLYFNCPIIVSKGTYLGEKVDQLGIGYSIDSMNEESVLSFVNEFDHEDYNVKLNNCEMYPKSECIDCYDFFFDSLDGMAI